LLVWRLRRLQIVEAHERWARAMVVRIRHTLLPCAPADATTKAILLRGALAPFGFKEGVDVRGDACALKSLERGTGTFWLIHDAL
jgi:hypothetical protein